MADTHIIWDEGELDKLLNSPDGPVGELLDELSAKATAIAIAAAPVQKPENYSWGRKASSSYMPWSGGYTKANIKQHIGYTKSGTLFGGVNAPYGPTLFLEKPARQMHHSYPFMSTALYSISL